jgi:hypothetical protein
MSVLSTKKRFKPALAGLYGLIFLSLGIFSGCDAPPGPPGSGGMPMSGGPPGSMGGMPRPAGNFGPAPPGLTTNSSPTTLSPNRPSAMELAKPPITATPKPGESADKNKSADNKPADGQMSTTLDKLENDGNTINLASALLTSGLNPFLDRLPKPLKPVESPTDGSTAPPPIVAAPPDPFESITLVGILYSATKPMALISAGTESKMVQKGTQFTAGENSFRILKILQNTIQIQVNGGQIRTMTLPDIIGFGSTPSDASSSGTPPRAQNVGPTSATGMPSALKNLTNLQKLSQTTSTGGPSPKLEEPTPSTSTR